MQNKVIINRGVEEQTNKGIEAQKNNGEIEEYKN